MRVHRAPLHSYMLREGLKDQRPRRAVEHKPGGSRKERSGAEDRLLQLAVAYDEENHPHRACARPAATRTHMSRVAPLSVRGRSSYSYVLLVVVLLGWVAMFGLTPPSFIDVTLSINHG